MDFFLISLTEIARIESTGGRLTHLPRCSVHHFEDVPIRITRVSRFT
jgi:hypothetical protein